MSYTELEHGYQGLRQATQPQFYVGDDGNLVPIRSSVSPLHCIVGLLFDEPTLGTNIWVSDLRLSITKYQ